VARGKGAARATPTACRAVLAGGTRPSSAPPRTTLPMREKTLSEGCHRSPASSPTARVTPSVTSQVARTIGRGRSPTAGSAERCGCVGWSKRPLAVRNLILIVIPYRSGGRTVRAHLSDGCLDHRRARITPWEYLGRGRVRRSRLGHRACGNARPLLNPQASRVHGASGTSCADYGGGKNATSSVAWDDGYKLTSGRQRG
jgi:hypothetical protein